MIEKITLDMLTADSVSARKQSYVSVESVEYPLGVPWRKAYFNSYSGRIAVEADLPQAQQDAILAIWGDTSTVTDAVIV